MKVTPLMVFYGLFAAVGAVVPWYFNVRYMRESGEILTPQRWLAGGFINPLTGSITSDFLIGTIPVLVGMVVEDRECSQQEHEGQTSGRG
jgi:Terpene cyclase DEP1